MSAPNKSFDPKQVSALSAEAIDKAVAEAITAINAATTLDELKEARLAHTGDRSPLALANREIGALPPAAKAETGKRLGEARGQVNQTLALRTVDLEKARDNALLATETVDVTTVSAALRGGRHPLTTIQEQIADVLSPLATQLPKDQKLKPNGLTLTH